MSQAGYSGKPLLEKLGYQPGQKVFTLRAPDWFLKALDDRSITPAVKPPVDWAHIFCVSRTELTNFLDKTDLSGFSKGFWVSWPKKSSGIETDVTEQILRDLILPLGWVDTKVCAVDDTWSSLKFLRRRKY